MKEKDKKELEQVKLELAKSDAIAPLTGIKRCVVRLERLIELNAPITIAENEVRMIQYRALAVLAAYEIAKELKQKTK